MEKADSSRRASKSRPNSLPLLAILAKDVGDLAVNEKEVFSPILKNWHPFAAGVAVATLHACYGNELKQFISGIGELTPDAVQVLRAADKLEKDLVQIAVGDSVDSDDGGKAIIREMPPYEADSAIANLVKSWMKTRLDRMKELVDQNVQQEVCAIIFMCFCSMLLFSLAKVLYEINSMLPSWSWDLLAYLVLLALSPLCTLFYDLLAYDMSIASCSQIVI